MKLKVFAVFDSKVGAYLTPFFMRTAGEAMRALENTARDASTTFSKHPADYTLFEIGSYDDATAKFDMPSTPLSLCVVSELIASEGKS